MNEPKAPMQRIVPYPQYPQFAEDTIVGFECFCEDNLHSYSMTSQALFRPTKLLIWDCRNLGAVSVKSVAFGRKRILPLTDKPVPLSLLLEHQPMWPTVSPGEAITIELFNELPPFEICMTGKIVR